METLTINNKTYKVLDLREMPDGKYSGHLLTKRGADVLLVHTPNNNWTYLYYLTGGGKLITKTQDIIFV